MVLKDGVRDRPRPTAGFTAERLAMFTDAIVAIAITLLVIEIERPGEEELRSAASLRHFLADESDSFIAFALAFFLLWSVWRRHHILMDEIDRLNRPLIAGHAALLFLVALLPYPTGIIGHAFANPLAICLFASAEAALTFCEAAVKETTVRTGILKSGVDPEVVRASACASWAVALFFVLTAVLCWWVPHVPFSWFAAPIVAYYGGQLFERLRSRNRS